jgi:hypothetical protein
MRVGSIIFVPVFACTVDVFFVHLALEVFSLFMCVLQSLVRKQRKGVEGHPLLMTSFVNHVLNPMFIHCPLLSVHTSLKQCGAKH